MRIAVVVSTLFQLGSASRPSLLLRTIRRFFQLSIPTGSSIQYRVGQPLMQITSSPFPLRPKNSGDCWLRKVLVLSKRKLFICYAPSKGTRTGNASRRAPLNTHIYIYIYIYRKDSKKSVESALHRLVLACLYHPIRLPTTVPRLRPCSTPSAFGARPTGVGPPAIARTIAANPQPIQAL